MPDEPARPLPTESSLGVLPLRKALQALSDTFDTCVSSYRKEWVLADPEAVATFSAATGEVWRHACDMIKRLDLAEHGEGDEDGSLLAEGGRLRAALDELCEVLISHSHREEYAGPRGESVRWVGGEVVHVEFRAAVNVARRELANAVRRAIHGTSSELAISTNPARALNDALSDIQVHGNKFIPAMRRLEKFREEGAISPDDCVGFLPYVRRDDSPTEHVRMETYIETMAINPFSKWQQDRAIAARAVWQLTWAVLQAKECIAPVAKHTDDTRKPRLKWWSVGLRALLDRILATLKLGSDPSAWAPPLGSVLGAGVVEAFEAEVAKLQRVRAKLHALAPAVGPEETTVSEPVPEDDPGGLPLIVEPKRSRREDALGSSEAPEVVKQPVIPTVDAAFLDQSVQNELEASPALSRPQAMLIVCLVGLSHMSINANAFADESRRRNHIREQWRRLGTQFLNGEVELIQTDPARKGESILKLIADVERDADEPPPAAPTLEPLLSFVCNAETYCMHAREAANAGALEVMEAALNPGATAQRVALLEQVGAMEKTLVTLRLSLSDTRFSLDPEVEELRRLGKAFEVFKRRFDEAAAIVPESEVTPAAPSSSPPPISPYQWMRDGSMWRVRFDDESGTFDNLKGMETFARLLRFPNPQRVQSPTQLMGLASTDGGAPLSKQEAFVKGDSTEISERYKNLQLDIEEAEERGDVREVEQLRDQRQRLAEMVRTDPAYSRFGLNLQPPGGEESARKAIYQRLKAVYSKLEAADPPVPKLIDHLKKSIVAADNSYVYRPIHSMESWDL